MSAPIDPQSAQFIAWAQGQLQDEAFYHWLVESCKHEMETYFSHAADQIRDQLLAKLEKGALEHGAASFATKDIGDELRQEYLDILGWSLIKLFVREAAVR